MTHRHYATEYDHRLHTSANEQTIMSKIAHETFYSLNESFICYLCNNNSYQNYN